jgi:hypothetical protein
VERDDVFEVDGVLTRGVNRRKESGNVNMSVGEEEEGGREGMTKPERGK